MRRRNLRNSRGETARWRCSCPSPPNCFGELAVRFAQESEGGELCTTPETSGYQISAASSFRSSNAPSEVTVEEMVSL